MADGATPKELLFEACRRNNTTLLNEVLEEPSLSASSAKATFLNNTTDALGATALHLAAQSGSYEVLDIILDQEDVEIDQQEKRNGDTPLHKAARYCNTLSQAQWSEDGRPIIEILVDAGCDPRIRNSAKKRAVDLLDTSNRECADILRRAEMTITMAGPDVEEEDDADQDGGSGSE